MLCYDTIFKAVFTEEDNLLAKMVSDITGIDYELLKDNIILETTELPISTKNEKAKRCDFVLRIIDDKIINLELNAYRYNGLIIKNLSYLFQLFTSSSKKGEEYNDDLVVMQINLNCYKDELFKPLSKYLLQEDNTHKIYVKNLAIFDLNVVKCHELYYNLDNKEDIPNYIRWGALIYCNNINDIPDIVEGILTNEERNRIMSKLSKLTREDLFYTEEEALEWAEWERRSIITEIREKAIAEVKAEALAEAKAEALSEGQTKGKEETTKDLILSMIENGATLEFVSKVTNKTIEEINDIIKKQ